jgi:D-alanyl-D-alanine carboxypeptidase/D-alanyl-D-alanine-endopeptidase (penicillin-binding protein 4)
VSAAALLLAANAMLAVPAVPPKPAAAGALRARVERALQAAATRDGLRHALWGVEVRSLVTGRVLYARQADTSLLPASSMKLATTAAALDAFGPDARFRTTLQSGAAIGADGVLAGDLYLVGAGDPSLSRELAAHPEYGAFELLADGLYQAGVRRVAGALVGADGVFSGERRGADWTWEDLVWWYGAETAGLTFADGSVNLKISPGVRPGDPVRVERHPATDYLRVDSTAVTCAAEALATLTLRRGARNTIELSGCLPAGAPLLDRFVAVEDPAAYAAAVCAAALAARGIVVDRGLSATSVVPGGLRALATYEGAPMAEILKDVNKPSHNARAEMLLRLVGAKVKGAGTVEAGRDAVLAFLGAHGVDTEGWEIADGSGLSRTDLVTAHGYVDLLAAMDKHPQAAVFEDSLPVAGTDGTLKRRLSGPRTSGRVHAKTGTLTHTSALVGYAEPARGDRLAFAILVNHATAPGAVVHDAIDGVVEALFDR